MTSEITSQNSPKASGRTEMLFFLTGFILVVFGWFLWAVLSLRISSSIPNERLNSAGTFGDLFGGINALFTGIGIVFLAFTIWQQGLLIKQQLISIDQVETELKNQKDSFQREQALQSLLRIREILQAKPVRAAREIVLSGQGQPNDLSDLIFVLIKEQAIREQDRAPLMPKFQIKNKTAPTTREHKSASVSPLTKAEQLTLRWYRAAELVLHSYDFLGLLLKSNCFESQDIENIKDTWGESIKRCNSKLNRYLDTPFRPKDITLNKNLIEVINTISLEGRPRSELLQLLDHGSQLHGLQYKNFKSLVIIATK